MRKKSTSAFGRSCAASRALGTRCVAAAALALPFGLPGGAAHAFEIRTDNPDLKLRWDNTFKYSNAFRVKSQSERLLQDVNLDDGDRNFDKGLISNRIDLLSEVDVGWKSLGFRASGAAWYDTVYNRRNDHDSPASANSTSVGYNRFTDATRELHGRKAEVLDFFAFGKTDLGSMPLTVRLGRHTLIYGESLFFGSNGIAAAQGPVDLVKLLTVPSSQFKEILRPVEQISSVLQINSQMTLGAYYQFKFRESIIPAAGSYLSAFDFVGDGAERFIVGAPITPGGGAAAFWRGADIEARNSGQGGLQFRWAPAGSEWEFGVYAARYHDKGAALYLTPSAAPDVVSGRVGAIQQVYHEGIKTYGASATTSIGQLNLAFEGSIRRNASLVSDPQVVLPGVLADNDAHPLYAVGNTAHAQVSGIYVLSETALWDAGAFLGEVAWNRRLSIDKNPGALDPNTTRDAAALRFIFEPSYFQVVDGIDLSLPIGVGYNFYGRSSSIFNFNGGSSKGGDFSIGVKATYRTVWQAGLTYTGYYGGEDTFLTPANSPTPVLSYKQFYKDRNFISFSLQRAL